MVAAGRAAGAPAGHCRRRCGGRCRGRGRRGGERPRHSGGVSGANAGRGRGASHARRRHTTRPRLSSTPYILAACSTPKIPCVYSVYRRRSCKRAAAAAPARPGASFSGTVGARCGIILIERVVSSGRYREAANLRYGAWEESRRRRVERQGGGRPGCRTRHCNRPTRCRSVWVGAANHSAADVTVTSAVVERCWLREVARALMPAFASRRAAGLCAPAGHGLGGLRAFRGAALAWAAFRKTTAWGKRARASLCS